MNVSEKNIVEAVKTRGTKTVANTTVKYSVATELTTVELHGNKIAEYDHSTDKLKINFCGYVTKTTRSRINAICESLNRNTWFNFKQGVIHKNILRVKQGAVAANEWIEVTE